MGRTLYSNEERRKQFLKVGLKLAKKNGISRVRIAGVAEAAGVSPPLVSHVFGTRDKMRDAIRAHAKETGVDLDTHTVERSARSGRFVDKGTNKRRPASTVRERVTRRRK